MRSPGNGRCALGAGGAGRDGEEGPRDHRGHFTGPDDKQSETGPLLTLAGEPGELTMFGAGRQGATRVEISGDAALAARLRAASLGV